MPPPVYRSARYLARPDEDSKPLDDPRGTAGRRAYTTSKLCNVLFTYELERKLRAEKSVGSNGRSITVNAFDPGLMPGTGWRAITAGSRDSHGASCCPLCARSCRT